MSSDCCHCTYMQGIDRARVEQMEARLKEDILREAERYSGDIMVNHETDDGQIYDAWESVGPGAVQTPLEVYECLKAAGFLVEYARVPITDGKAPKSSDFGALASRIATAPGDTAFVFNCQASPTNTLECSSPLYVIVVICWFHLMYYIIEVSCFLLRWGEAVLPLVW